MPLELEAIARELYVSPYYFVNVIRELTGQHPIHFYKSKTLDFAKELLIETQLSFAKVARRLGYDPSSFAKLFKKYTGMTPSEFRRINRIKEIPFT